MFSKKAVVFFFCLTLPLCFALRAQAGVPPEELSRQEALALEYQFRCSRAADVKERERLYLQIVEECPATMAAEEALWAVSSLYLDDFDEPQEDNARKALERFLKEYPSSPWLPHVENRLLWLYEGTDDLARTVGLFESILRRDMPSDIRKTMEQRYAQAREKLARTK